MALFVAMTTTSCRNSERLIQLSFTASSETNWHCHYCPFNFFFSLFFSLLLDERWKRSFQYFHSSWHSWISTENKLTTVDVWLEKNSSLLFFFFFPFLSLVSCEIRQTVEPRGKRLIRWKQKKRWINLKRSLSCEASLSEHAWSLHFPPSSQPFCISLPVHWFIKRLIASKHSHKITNWVSCLPESVSFSFSIL